MENLVNKDNFAQENQKDSVNLECVDVNALGGNASATSPINHVSEQQQLQNQPQKTKRKHRRGKPKPKNANKPYKNWKFQVPRPNFNGCGGGMNNRNGARPKILRSRSLVPYNTNKFLMEEHLAEVPSSLLTPSGRTRDSSFSVDSEDNYFFSLPEDEEEFLTKEFANVYEKARVERLENLTKQQLIEECLQIEDRYSSDQGRQQQLNAQRISSEYMSKIRILEEKVRELSRENYNLRCQLMRSAAMAVAASPPSAAPPTGAACQPTPMDSSSVDSESDSSSSSSSSSSSNKSAGVQRNNNVRQRRFRRSCSSRSSLSDYRASNENDAMESDEGDNIVAGANLADVNAENKSVPVLANFNCEGRQSIANDENIIGDAEMEDDFPSFSPILESVDTAVQPLENATTAALEAPSYNKIAEATDSAEHN